MAHLTELARRQKRPKSMVAEAALESLLTPDDADRREAAITRRLDQMTRQVQGLERDLNISVEALALLISLWLIVMGHRCLTERKQPRTRRHAGAITPS